jgi:hypothetical protein
MKLSRCLSSCLSALILYVCGAGISLAQPTVTTTASPWRVGTPLTLSACGGPKTFQVSFYVGTTPSNVFAGNPIATVNKPPGTPATYNWTPTQEGEFYLGAETNGGQTYCGPNPGLVTTQWILAAPSYFGFYDSSDSFGDPDETPATSSFANTTWISCTSPADCHNRLQEAQNYNMHAVVEDFSSPGLPAPGSSSTTVQNWLTSYTSNWQSYTSVFSPYVANGTIAAFFPYDEPFGVGWSSGNNASTTTTYLASAGSVIKQSFPSAKVGTFFSGTLTFTYLTHGQNVIPSNFDWIGIDIYSCWYTCSSNGLSEPYTWYVQTLEANLYSGQKVILLPASAYNYGGTLAQFHANPPSDIYTQVTYSQNILDLAGTDPHVIGVFGFLYQTINPNGPSVWVGTSDLDMGRMLAIFEEFGQDVEKR